MSNVSIQSNLHLKIFNNVSEARLSPVPSENTGTPFYCLDGHMVIHDGMQLIEEVLTPQAMIERLRSDAFDFADEGSMIMAGADGTLGTGDFAILTGAGSDGSDIVHIFKGKKQDGSVDNTCFVVLSSDPNTIKKTDQITLLIGTS